MGQDDQRRLLYANRKVLISPVGENLLVLGGLVFSGSMHSSSRAQMLDFSPAHLAGQLHEFGRGGGVSRGSAATHGDTRSMELIADGGPMNGQLRTDLA